MSWPPPWRPTEDGRPQLQSWVGPRWVSTVSMEFTGTSPHFQRLLGYGFETMVQDLQTGEWLSEYTRRYHTQAEASHGHCETVERLMWLDAGGDLVSCSVCGELRGQFPRAIGDYCECGGRYA